MNEAYPQVTTFYPDPQNPAIANSDPVCPQEEWFARLPLLSEEFLDRHQRPLVTVSYAQSVDGCIASRDRQQLQLSGPQSMVLTHRIRAACDCVVIGINTLLVDNPQLTVRHSAGPSPQPLVLDSNLRTPVEARLLERPDHGCWLACTAATPSRRETALQERGAEIIRCGRDGRGRVDLADLLAQLGKRGIRSVMVEGGSQVISSFIEARLVDQMIITIAPHLVGGLAVLARPTGAPGSLLRLQAISYQACGPDIILWAQPRWQEP